MGVIFRAKCFLALAGSSHGINLPPQLRALRGDDAGCCDSEEAPNFLDSSICDVLFKSMLFAKDLRHQFMDFFFGHGTRGIKRSQIVN